MSYQTGEPQPGAGQQQAAPPDLLTVVSHCAAAADSFCDSLAQSLDSARCLRDALHGMFDVLTAFQQQHQSQPQDKDNDNA